MASVFRGWCRGFSAAAFLFSAVFAGCQAGPQNSPASIETGPSFPVRYATERISPAVVQLDVVTESFSGGNPVEEQSIGSGFIIDKEGRVLTNFHVAGRAKRIELTLADQEHVRGTLIGSDHWTDLALVQMDMDEVHRKGLSFQIANLGDSSQIILGGPVMAVGTPYGLSRTVTSGIISNTDRSFNDGEMTIEGGYETGWFNNWIQTDAAINPGNSGGPLINLRGEVIGINTRGISSGNNLGFAIPINTAKAVAKELLTNGKVTRSYIGVELQPMQDLEKFYDVAGNRGVLIRNVEDNSPAKTAGVQAEDILLSVNGVPVDARFPEQLRRGAKAHQRLSPGQQTCAPGAARRSGFAQGRDRLRGARTQRFRDRIASQCDDLRPRHDRQAAHPHAHHRRQAGKLTVTEEAAVPAWGLTVRDLTRAYLRERRLAFTKGVLVTGTRVGSPADRANLQAGDIIIRVDDRPVTSVDELKEAVAKWAKAPPAIVGVDVERDRGQLPLGLKP